MALSLLASKRGTRYAPKTLRYHFIHSASQDKLLNDVFKPANEKLAANLEKILKESTSGFLVNSGYTWADFLVAENLLTNEEAVPGSLDAHPKLKEYKDRVYNIPKIKDYVANRKITTW